MEVLLCIVGQLSSLNPGYLPQARLESSQVPFAQAVIRRTLSSTVCTLARPQDKVETSMGSEALHAIPALAVNRLFGLKQVFLGFKSPSVYERIGQ